MFRKMLSFRLSVIFDWVCTEEISAKPHLVLFFSGIKKGNILKVVLLDFLN